MFKGVSPDVVNLYNDEYLLQPESGFGKPDEDDKADPNLRVKVEKLLESGGKYFCIRYSYKNRPWKQLGEFRNAYDKADIGLEADSVILDDDFDKLVTRVKTEFNTMEKIQAHLDRNQKLYEDTREELLRKNFVEDKKWEL